MHNLRFLVTTILPLFFFVNSFAQSYSSNPAVQDTCLDKKFSVVFYVVLDSNFNTISSTVLPPITIMTDPTLQIVIDTLNYRFKNICVSFERCTTIYIPNYRYKGWYDDASEEMITSVWYTPNTINIYVVDTVYPSASGEVEGYTYRPTNANLAQPKKDLLVIDARFMLMNRCALPVHLMGHFFGLPHTHEEINPGSPANPPPPPGVISMEFANNTSPNCQIHGDGFCDTEADNFNSSALQDGMGTYYVPPLDNIMSYYTSTRYRFTAMQYRHMVYNILTRRMYLH